MIRTDFVSNSSSSSFMIVGVCIDDETLCNIWTKHHREPYSESDSPHIIADELHVKYCRGLDNYYDDHIFGLTYSDMWSDETKEDFESRIKNRLEPMFGENLSIECCVDGGYNN